MNNRMLIGGIIVVVILVGVVIYLTRSGSTSIPVETASGPSATPARQAEEATPDAMTEDESESTVEGQLQEFIVTGSPFKFDIKQIKVKKGDKVKVTFKNAQGIHDFVIDEFEVQTKQLQAGQQEVVEFVADKAGTYKYYCSVGNHRAQGMEGILVVE